MKKIVLIVISVLCIGMFAACGGKEQVVGECVKCGEEQPLYEFTLKTGNRSATNNICKECVDNIIEDVKNLNNYNPGFAKYSYKAYMK